MVVAPMVFEARVVAPIVAASKCLRRERFRGGWLRYS